MAPVSTCAFYPNLSAYVAGGRGSGGRRPPTPPPHPETVQSSEFMVFSLALENKTEKRREAGKMETPRGGLFGRPLAAFVVNSHRSSKSENNNNKQGTRDPPRGWARDLRNVSVGGHK